AVNVSAGKKVLLSANFDDGSVVFNGWGNNQTRDVVDGAFHVNNPSAVQPWESQIAYDFEDAFLPDAEYSITMRIRGSAPGQITFGLQNADDYYKSVGEFGTIDFDEDWKDVKVNCICNGEGGRRLIASIGDFEGDIYIDDFEFYVGTDDESNNTYPKTWDFTKGFSEETLAGLENDSWYWGCWYAESETRYTLQCDKSMLTYYGVNGKEETLKETSGLLFVGGNSGNIHIDHGLNTPCIKFNSTTPTVTIPELTNGMEITIVTKTGNKSSERGIACISGNATRISGAEASLEEITNVFEVTCEEGTTTDVTFQPYNGGINIYSIAVDDITTIEQAVEKLLAVREEVVSYADILGDSLGFAGLKGELMAAYELTTSVDETSKESVKAEIKRLTEILQLSQSALESLNKFQALIAECETLNAANPWAELTAALESAKAVMENKATAVSTDYLAAYEILNGAYGNYLIKDVKLSDFNFSSQYNIGDFYVGLDDTYNVAQIYYYTGTDVNVVIPDILTYNNKEYVVVSLGDINGDSWYGSVFDYYGNVDASSIQSVKLPTTLRCIGQYAFMNCSSLTEIEIPNSVEMLGYDAFAYCSSLSSMIIPAKVNSIGSDVFYGCNNLHLLHCEAVEAPSCDGNLNSNIRVVYVPVGSGSSYRSASYWKNYIIVDGEGVSVTVNVETPGTLGELVLAQTENLSDVNYLTVTGLLDSDDIYNIQNRMPNLLTVDLSGTDMTSLPDDMFYQRYALQNVVLPSGLKSIGQSAFYQCYSIQNMELPTTLTTIGSSAFCDCNNLTSVEIPTGVTQLSNSAFYSCNKLETVIFNEGLQTISSSAFGYCISLKEVDFPASLKTIGSYAFGNCSNLSRVIFKEGLTTLQYEAFEYCHALTEVTLPSTLMYCYYPFYYCNNLKTVKCLSLIPPANEDNRILYSDNMESCVLYVPAWTINKYKLTKGWDQFQTIKPLDNYWPENIALMDEFTLTLPDSLPVDYKPNLSLMHTDDNSYSYYNWMYGALSVNGNQTLSLGTVKMVYDQNMFYDYGRNYAPWYTSLVNNAAMRADSICITLYLRDDRWVFVSFPFDVKVSDIQAMSENTNFVIRKYSGKARAEANFDNTWQDMTVDSVLHAGEGYIWQCSSPNENYCGFYVSAVNNANKNLMFANETRAIALNEYQAEFSHNRSWNLIGNPFPCYYDTRAMEFTAPITVWNEYYSTYEAYSPMDDDYILRPGEAFFVQRPIDKESISFPTDGRQTNWEVKERSTYNGARSVSAPRQVFNLSLNMDSLSDRTRFVINADAEMGYDMSRDASKFMSSDSRVPQLFTVEGDVYFAINERPMGNGVIALGAYFGSEGTYTLALDTEVQTEVMLVDKLTGKEVNLAAADYTFSAEAGTVTDRFEIKFGGATSVEENLAQQVSVQVVDGQIIVNGAEASVYTTDGKLVATVQGNTALDVTPGLYIVKAQGKSYKVSVVK
ncbi:MAG: leucine-rich repeat domain-containing protein, partial [Bacteroidaceae bacterium]|nr:leucine-rich repeat domain-containing protein [Bacteroidaceae bacterium]